MNVIHAGLLLLSLGIGATGAPWIQSEGLEGGGITDICVQDSCFFVATSGGMFSSSDNGDKWSLVNTDFPTCNFTSLAANERTLFAVEQWNRGVYRSDDKGLSWTRMEVIFSTYGPIITTCDSIIFASTSGGLFRSSDNGHTWTDITPRIYINGRLQLPLNPFLLKDNAVFTVVRDSVYKSIDEGLINWTAIGRAPGRFIYSFTVHDSDILAVADYKVFRSADDGATWTPVTIGSNDTLIMALAVKDSIILAGTARYGVFRSRDNGAHWSTVNSGLKNASVYSLAAIDSTVIAGTQAGIYLSIDYGIHWDSARVGNDTPGSMVVSCLLVKGRDIFAATANSIFFSGNNGTSWKQVDSGLPDTTIHSLIASGDTLLAGTSNGIFMSDNNGTSWRTVNSRLKEVRALAVQGDSIIAGSAGGGVCISSDYGATWTDHIRIDPNGWDFNVGQILPVGKILVACGVYGIYRSTNNGQFWSLRTSLMPESYGYNCLFLRGNILYAGMAGGLYMSSDTGKSWTCINDNLKNQVVYSIAANNDTLYIGTHSGVWHRPLSDFKLAATTPEHAATAIHGYNMKVSGTIGTSVSISFSLPRREQVGIAVFGISGNAVQKIVNSCFEAGSHTLKWNTRSLPAGFYLVKMKTPTSGITRKFTCLR